MKTLSIRQPFASFICRVIKTIENRSWDTKYRGKLLIHASGRAIAWPTFNIFLSIILKDIRIIMVLH